MSGMHLLPAYWTTNNTKKRKKKVVSKKEQLAILEHEKFLKRMGVKRSVAQPGSASALGAEGQRFKSSRSDQNARVAQTAEQLICNHQVGSSSPPAGTTVFLSFILYTVGIPHTLNNLIRHIFGRKKIKIILSVSVIKHQCRKVLVVVS